MRDPDKILVLDAATAPGALGRLEEIVARMRSALIPMLDASLEQGNDDQFAMDQSLIISGAALLAGMTVGHMTFVGTMQPRDRKRAEKIVAVNFRNGIKFGLDEARRAAVETDQIN